jgi:hypothetical protein
MGIEPERRRLAGKRLLLLAGLVATIAFALTVGFVWVMLRVPADSPDARCATSWRFDAEAWQDHARAFSEQAIRACMVEDLLGRFRLMGMPRDEVLRLLGPRDDTPYFKDWELVYWLGPEPGPYRIDSQWLGVRFDPKGNVSEVRRLTD